MEVNRETHKLAKEALSLINEIVHMHGGEAP